MACCSLIVDEVHDVRLADTHRHGHFRIDATSSVGIVAAHNNSTVLREVGIDNFGSRVQQGDGVFLCGTGHRAAQSDT